MISHRILRSRRAGSTLVSLAAALLLLSSLHCGRDPEPGPPPVAPKKPHRVESPHGTRIDEYYWLRDDTRSDPEVLGYLEAENAYLERSLAPLAELREQLYQELVGRLAAAEDSLPHLDRGFWYRTRFPEGAEYPLHQRREDREGSPWEVLLDVAELAEGHGFYSATGLRVSPGGKRLGFAEDTSGRRIYTLRFRDLATGGFLPDRIPGASPYLAWADAETVYYLEKDPVTLLGRRVRRHRLGEDPEQDPVVYEETDTSFYMGLGTTSDHRYVVLQLTSTTSDEVRFLDPGEPERGFRPLTPRARPMKMDADHLGGRWVIRTNWGARDFRLMQVEDGKVGDRERWSELVPGEEGVLIRGFELFESHLVVQERRREGPALRVRHWASGAERRILPEQDGGTLWLEGNHDPSSPRVRYASSSLAMPRGIFEQDLATGRTELLRRDPVLGGFDPGRYVTERRWARARDGVEIPVTLVHRVDTRLDGTAPVYQYGYGSYGTIVEPLFRSHVISLLDRGFVYAIAHIRGSSTLGRGWYEDGKLLKKKNTFRDFVDVTEFLLEQRIAAPGRVVMGGGSAGGLLMGAVVNDRPDLYRAVVAHVPFVDVVTTMLDESIPLTTNEFDEWGNPKEKPFYDYMLSYSPYDQVAARDYPAMLVTTGLWDSQVQYFEPAKWVARLRDRKTDSQLLLLHTNMEAGHGGATGRFRRYRELALEYAFVLDQLGLISRR